MKFPADTTSKAFLRQSPPDGLGTRCARCCRRFLEIIPRENIMMHPIPVVPVEQGGKGADNCVIVCPDCYREIGQDGTKTIPLSELRCFTA